MADPGGAEKIMTSGLMESPAFGITFFKLTACVAAIYLLVLDRTKWKTTVTTALLVPYIFFTLPNVIFFWFRGEVWKWVAFLGVVLRLFLPKNYREWLELPGAVLVVVMLIAPEFVVREVKDGEMSDFACLCIACYLLHEHVQASDGLRNAFRRSNGISNSVGIVCLFLYPIWRSILRFVSGIGS